MEGAWHLHRNPGDAHALQFQVERHRARDRGFQQARWHHLHRFENNSFTELCSGSETGSYLRLIDFVYHSTLGLRVIKKKFWITIRLRTHGERGGEADAVPYRGTSLIRNSLPSLGPP